MTDLSQVYQDNIWTSIGPLPLLSVFLGLIVLITINVAWYVNTDATPGWIITVCVLNILMSLLFLGIMLYILRIAGSFLTARFPETRKISEMNLGMNALNSNRIMLLVIGLFILLVSSASFASQRSAQTDPNDQTNYFAAIISGIIISVAGFLLLMLSYNEYFAKITSV